MLAESLNAGNWISIAAIFTTVFLAGMGWMSAMFIRIGKVLQEIRGIKNQVDVLGTAFDSQVKVANTHEVRLTKMEERMMLHLEKE